MIHMGSDHRSVMARFVFNAPSNRDPRETQVDEGKKRVIKSRSKTMERKTLMKKI